MTVDNLLSLFDSSVVRTVAVGAAMLGLVAGAVGAFAVLRRYSQNNNVKLRDLAEHLVETKELPSHSTSREVDAGGEDSSRSR